MQVVSLHIRVASNIIVVMARKLLLHVLLLSLGPFLMVNAKAFCCYSSPHVGKSFHDRFSVVLAPILHDSSTVVGVDLDILVSKQGIESHANHPRDTTAHHEHDWVGGRITEPLLLEVVVLLDDFLWVHGGFAAELERLVPRECLVPGERLLPGESLLKT